MTDEKKEVIHPPIGRLAKDDPIAKAMEGIDRQVAEGVISTALGVKHQLGGSGDDIDHRLLSASCTAYIYGAMFVLVELYRDLGHDDKEATEKALEYLNTAGAMVVKHISPPETEH